MPETDGLVTLRERVRERLAEIIAAPVAHRNWTDMAEDRADLRLRVREGDYDINEPTKDDCRDAADAILREFRLQPVAWGRVTEGGEVEGL